MTIKKINMWTEKKTKKRTPRIEISETTESVGDGEDKHDEV